MIKLVAIVEVTLFVTILVTSRASPLQHDRANAEKSYEGFLENSEESQDILYRNNILNDYGWRKQGLIMKDIKRDQSFGNVQEEKEEEDKRNHRKAHSFRGMMGKRYFDQQRPLQAERRKCVMEVVLGFLLDEEKTITEPEVKHVLTRCKENTNSRLQVGTVLDN